MSDPAWILVAVTLGVAGFWLGDSIRARFGRSAVGRLVSELTTWLGYCSTLAVWAAQANNG